MTVEVKPEIFYSFKQKSRVTKEWWHFATWKCTWKYGILQTIWNKCDFCFQSSEPDPQIKHSKDSGKKLFRESLTKIYNTLIISVKTL